MICICFPKVVKNLGITVHYGYNLDTAELAIKTNYIFI